MDYFTILIYAIGNNLPPTKTGIIMISGMCSSMYKPLKKHN